jgi:uncharacterized protein YegP (UPF0339 family)
VFVVSDTGCSCDTVLHTGDRRSTVAGKFELNKDAGGKFRLRLEAGNGEIIASSEAYNSKAAAQQGIESVKASAPAAAVDDQT